MFRGTISTRGFERKPRGIMLPWKKSAKNFRSTMVWKHSRNRYCWVRLLIFLRQMLASRQRKNPLLKKKNHECIEPKSFPGADSDGRGADGPARARFCSVQERKVSVSSFRIPIS